MLKRGHQLTVLTFWKAHFELSGIPLELFQQFKIQPDRSLAVVVTIVVEFPQELTVVAELLYLGFEHHTLFKFVY